MEPSRSPHFSGREAAPAWHWERLCAAGASGAGAVGNPRGAACLTQPRHQNPGISWAVATAGRKTQPCALGAPAWGPGPGPAPSAPPGPRGGCAAGVWDQLPSLSLLSPRRQVNEAAGPRWSPLVPTTWVIGLRRQERASKMPGAATGDGAQENYHLLFPLAGA